ncbi:MAG: adenylosuccinate synthetase [Xanthomarina sp.]|uniref:Adenylosuccinate synthetase n=1 Tax=Xanthomarina gelatinilytica TaxID=1137281 RepID=A0A3C0F2Y4_9FLAO|nr:adenylosuccinate synthetase [Xanthomarina sp.]MBF61175.1 adenylosuccinate synthetase [Xanthomarina sp.]HAB28741.1 adenylosuccinate synthetase [Xanthomarina gelatinilytica]HAI17933.1 adenylosuccinate synthetase [Xanthomarina gelatinilytica]HCY81117.1 adenylosuccinate synthetase [Xanthomarina gelatinilytica]
MVLIKLTIISQISSYSPKSGDIGTIDQTRLFYLVPFIILPNIIIILYFIWRNQ